MSVLKRDVNKTYFQDQDQDFHALSAHFVKDSYKQCTRSWLHKIMKWNY